MRVSEIRPSELGQPERDVWDWYLRPDAAPASAFMSWRFAQAVGDVREDARIAVVEDDSGVLAFLPYHRRPMGLARPIGAPFSDQHGPVVRPGEALDLSAVLKALGLTAYMHTALPAGAAATVGPVFSAEPVYVADPGDDPEAYFARKKQEHASRYRGLRKRTNKAERERGPVEVRLDDPDPTAFELIMTLKRRQFRMTGKHDVLGPDWTRAMFERLRDGDAPDFGLRVSTLRLNATMAAGEICLLGAGSLHSWIVSYDPELSDYAPGLQLLTAMIRNVRAMGAQRLDLGTGHGHYKSVYADPEGRYLEGAACAAGMGGALRRASLGLWRAAETAPLGPVSPLAGKLRRRGAQIASVETGFTGRARGVLTALTGSSAQSA